MKKEPLLSIKDDNENELFYYFTPAGIISNFVPLAVVLDTPDNDKILNFEYKMWNMLTPVNFDKNNAAAKELLCKLIQKISQEYECEDYIYLCDTVFNEEAEAFVHNCKRSGVDIESKSFSDTPDGKEQSLKKLLDLLEHMDR
jgi:hypothetical protein